MIVLYIIGLIVFAVKLIRFSVKAAWGLTKGLLLGIGIPVVLITLFIAGLVSLAVPLLVLLLLAAFIWPIVKSI